MSDVAPDPPRRDEGWLRLHPLTPIARIGRLVPALVLLLLVSTVHSKAENGTAETDYLVVFTLLSAVYGYIHWMVTRWRFEGDTLRIETGLIRKDSRRLPLARIQAVDIVRPFLARLLGVSELRIRLAGSGSTDGKLAYLSEAQAAELRLLLLAGHVDTEAAASSNTGLPMASVDLARLLALGPPVAHHHRAHRDGGGAGPPRPVRAEDGGRPRRASSPCTSSAPPA